MPSTQQSELAPAARRLILINACLGQFIAAVDARSVNIALPTLSTEFATTLEVVQWVPLSYQLTVIGLVLSLGRLGDMVGRKKIYTVGFVIFMTGSALCGLAGGIAPMVFFRVLEAIGGAMILANGRAIVSAVFAGGSRGKALGITSMAFHLGYIVGPSLGGFLIDSLGWRWIFFVNLPVALAGAVMAWRVMQESVRAKGRFSIDLLGMAALLCFAIFLVLGLNHAARYGFELRTAGLFALSAASLALFVFFERRAPEPLLDLSLFRKRLFAAGIVSLGLVSLSQTAIFFLLPFYLQGILSLSPTQVGLTLIFYSVVIVFVAPIGGSLSDRFGSRLLCTVGCACTFVSILAMARLGPDSSRMGVIIPLMGMGLGWALFASPNLSALFGSVAADRLGAVGGATVTAANMANAMGIALASMLFVRWLDWNGVAATGAANYKEWSQAPDAYLSAFHNSWMVFAAVAMLAVVTSAAGEGRGRSKR
ncbi:MAG TPA: MFS transporter [Candidatus Binatia bacterium]